MSGYDQERLLWRAALTIERRLARQVQDAITAGYTNAEIDYLNDAWIRAVRREGRRYGAYLRARLKARGVGPHRYLQLIALHQQRRGGRAVVSEREAMRRARARLKARKGPA